MGVVVLWQLLQPLDPLLVTNAVTAEKEEAAGGARLSQLMVSFGSPVQPKKRMTRKRQLTVVRALGIMVQTWKHL